MRPQPPRTAHTPPQPTPSFTAFSRSSLTLGSRTEARPLRADSRSGVVAVDARARHRSASDGESRRLSPALVRFPHENPWGGWRGRPMGGRGKPSGERSDPRGCGEDHRRAVRSQVVMCRDAVAVAVAASEANDPAPVAVAVAVPSPENRNSQPQERFLNPTSASRFPRISSHRQDRRRAVRRLTHSSHMPVEVRP